MNLIKDYDSNGCKVIMEVPSEGVTHAEITSLKLPELGEPSLQDRLVEALQAAYTYLDKPYTSGYGNVDILDKIRAVLASLDGTTK